MWLVFNKEILELLRDRKTLFFMIALPVLLFPLIFGGVAYFSSKAISEAQNKTLKLTVLGTKHAPELSKTIANSQQFELVSLADSESIEEAIRAGKVDFVIEIPVNYAEPLLASGQKKFKLYLNDAGLNRIRSRVVELVDSYFKEQQQNAFVSLGADTEQQKALLEPYAINTVDVADKRENWGEKLGGMVPYIIFLLCLQGAMLPASDLGAGEKERGTLETLLISPLERNQIILGKFFAIALAGVTSALVTVMSMAVWGVILGQGMAIKLVMDIVSAISALDFALMFLMLVPVVSIFAAVLLSLSIYARSYKEAQGYMTPMVFVVIVPVILALLPGVELQGGWAWVPLTNVALAIKELIKGTMDYFQLLAIFVSTASIASLALGFCIYWFNKEKVLFR